MDEDSENVFKGWENLDTDILVRIFQNYFSQQELISFRVAHVCRRWRVACCDPILWNTLDLSIMQYYTFIKASLLQSVYVQHRSNEKMNRFLKISMSLSKGNTRTLIFHSNPCPTGDMITYATRRCRNLRRLVLPNWNGIDERIICNAISFCKKLESLTMPSMKNPHFVFASIRENCKKFSELKVMGPVRFFFAQNLVAVLPKLKVLSLRCTEIDQDALIKILDKMKKLEILNISHSYIVVRDTTEIAWSTIVEKASKLKRFVTCMDHETCVMCQRTQEDEGILRWYPCEEMRRWFTFEFGEGLWKTDEVSSLHLQDCPQLIHCSMTYYYVDLSRFRKVRHS